MSFSPSPIQTQGELHLVGHSYGAALALEAARTLGSRVKSLALIEPVSFHLLRQEGRREWAEVEQLGKAVLGAVAKGDDRAAAASFMTYWLGRLRWFLSPERFKAAIAATIPKVALEFGIVVDAPTTLKDYAEITAPTLLVKGGKTRSADARRGRSSRSGATERQRRDAERRWAYEPLHPPRRDQPPDPRSSRGPALTRSGCCRGGAPSSPGSSAASRANSSSSSLACDRALARTFSTSV